MLRAILTSKKRKLLLLALACGFAGSATLFVFMNSTSNALLLTLIVLVVVMIIFANDVVFSLRGEAALAEERLREREELFSMVIRGINDGIFDFNLVTGEIHYAASYEAMLGYTLEEMGTTHDRFNALMHPDDLGPAWETAREYFERKVPTYKSVFRLRHKDGHWVWIVSRGIGIWDEKGNIERLIGTHTDISIQKEHEEEVQKLMVENERHRRELEIARDRAEDANNAKTDFLSTMSHEIRTPMNAVIGLSRIVLETPLAPKQKEMMETLHVNAEVLMQLVNNLLDLNRIEAASTRLENGPFSIAQTLQTIHTMFQSQMAAKKLKFSIINQVGSGTFIGDRSRIQQILVNLVSNALKFTTTGAVILTVSAERSGNGPSLVRFSVADTGIGISSENVSSVFEKFVQADHTISRRYGGSGLGLAICKSLATLMGGTLSLTSELNVGSTFMFELPLPTAESDAHQAGDISLEAAAAPVQSGTALVVEDYPANIMVATLMLENLGYEVEVARSGAEGLEKFEKRAAPFAVILMDVQMPEMDGYETTRRIRELEKAKGFSNYIIGVTANAFEHDRALCLQAGMNDYISKPIHQDLLEKKLSEMPRVAA